MFDCSWIETRFERLRPGDYRGTSFPTSNYNCIAWALGKTDNPWWPTDEIAGYVWPDGLPKEPLEQESLANFIRAFETEGYLVCDDDEFEIGFEKVAIYVGKTGNPLHAARSTENGKWTSKIGDEEDIEHATLESLEGSLHGEVKAFLKRRKH